MEMYRSHVLVCGGGACISSGSRNVMAAMEDELKKNDLQKEIKIIETGCMGPCDLGPIVVIYPEGVFYKQVNPDGGKKIVEEHLLKGRVVNELLYEEPSKGAKVETTKEISYFTKQVKNVLRNSGLINPESLEEYVARDGYAALAKVLTEMTPADVIDEVKKSGLRGRGGGGFPTGMKWELTAKQEKEQKYVVCNADEGDPGAFMDRSVLEGDPHGLIEAMSIAAYAVGANQGFVYVRAEYPLAIERLQKAINDSRENGLLGKNVFDTDFCFDLEIRIGAGAFVCGEETALLHSIEGKRGMPSPRPPYPAESGLWGESTLLNNVETYANVPGIILKGADWFASMGEGKSKGTKVFALAGNIVNTGLVEIPMGTTLREIIFDIGGGIPNGKEFKAVQCGGPSGGCLPTEYLDTHVTYENLIELGAMMGSGGMIIMDEDTCMVDLARFFLEFIQDESCGKCIPCREGTRKMLQILNRIVAGKGKQGDIELLENLGETISKASLCGLGKTAANPVISTLKYFRHEYEEHINDKKCRAKVCGDLIKYSIDAEKCIGCTACARKCPVDAIIGTAKKPHVIDPKKCIKCGECYNVCRFDAVKRD